MVKALGESGTIEAETNGILLRFDIDPTPYPPECAKYFPSSDFKPSVDEIKKRMDCRDMCIFTIDPATAKDLDDAVSCERFPDGTTRVGVHISDVTHFFTEGTDFDLAVANRATTVYLVDKVNKNLINRLGIIGFQVFHMLPKPLCNLCSLLPGEDKLAFSVFWEFDSDYNVINSFFKKTVINSCVQLSYSHAQRK